ncbi:hypothetical protein E2562_038598 [Oryza meyeriana var. granulata]|uniref:Uncharacterized protein n=1 Tax=Oryza meyeriana var. granulata TaxID=110450 RepID=A0A6G1DTA1_9ORYZ|nr:hypothetical protein E2562_038598 [Oryza meyeriana var. granulata]
METPMRSFLNWYKHVGFDPRRPCGGDHPCLCLPSHRRLPRPPLRTALPAVPHHHLYELEPKLPLQSPTC